MECTEKSPCRTQLSKSIADKIELIAKLRTELDVGRKTIGTSVDDQLVVAEMEYRLVKEEMALLNLQEQHWEAAAKWDIPPHTPDIQRELCEVLHSYIVSVREKGAIPALHAVEHPTGARENAVLISQGGDAMPRVEWAHHATELQAGDRLLEVNGHLVIGREPSDVSRILGRPLSRVVFLRPLSPNQALRGGGLRETCNLRQELTAVVSRLNKEMAEKARMTAQNKRIQSDCGDLKTQNKKLKLQVLSLQSILIYLYQALEKTNAYPNLLLQSESPATAFDMLRNIALDEHCSALCSGALKDMLSTHKKSIPWLGLTPQEDASNGAEKENADNR